MAHRLINFLEDNRINYITQGKNVTPGWVEIQCPYRWCSDKSKHLGINLNSGMHSCWVCGAKGGMEKLISILLKVPYGQAEEIAEEYGLRSSSFAHPVEEKVRAHEVSLPKRMKYVLPELHRKYLWQRNYDPDFIANRYGVGATLVDREWGWRLIIPVELDGHIVTFVGRDVTGRQTLRYKGYSDELSIRTTKETLYNIDSVDDSLIIVEGVFDMWRIGDPAVAIFGTALTPYQIELLKGRRLKKVLIWLDKTAKREAKKIEGALQNIVDPNMVFTYQYESRDPKDPDLFSQDRVRNIVEDFLAL